MMPASRGTKDSVPYNNTHGSTGGTGPSHALESHTQSGSTASENNWRSVLPPTVATTRVADPSAYGTGQDAQSTSNSAANTIATSRAAATNVPPGTTDDRHSSSHGAGTTGPYTALDSGTASDVAAAGVASSQSATRTASHGAKDNTVPLTQMHQHDAGHSSDLPKPYNVLPSGTPSGVNIEYKRRSKEIERQH